MRRIFLIFITLFLIVSSFPSQAQELIYGDHIYDPKIKTVQLYRGNFPNSYPILYLDNPLPLTLEFDELISIDDPESDFFIDFVACDHNWQPSYVLPIEFFEGFSQQRIMNFRRCENTKVHYVHYTFRFPGEENFFKMSGNYLIKVFRSSGDQPVVLTKRFLVAERKVLIQSEGLLNARLERQRFEEMQFSITPSSNLRIFNPANDLLVKVLQNWRWDQPLTGLQPRFLGNNKYTYFLDLRRGFAGGNEFRFHDLRSVRFLAESIKDVTETDEYYYLTLFTDEARPTNKYGSRPDLNGSFFIDVQEWEYPDFQADYVMNEFRLAYPQPLDNQRVYVFGELSNWQTRSEFQMQYNEAARRYEAKIPLKQGYYDYKYVAVENASGRLNESIFAGTPFDTENYYTILVYYRAPTDRYHRLIGYQPMNYYDE
jgi:hypothetical protein